MKRTMKEAAKCKCVPLLQGEHLAFFRTREPNEDIFMQTMPIRPGRTPDFTVQCWTCANFKNQIFCGEMFAGLRVWVHELQTAAEHNDKQGLVLKLLDGGRVGVWLNANQSFGAKGDFCQAQESRSIAPRGDCGAVRHVRCRELRRPRWRCFQDLPRVLASQYAG